jgi:hypothetical protein
LAADGTYEQRTPGDLREHDSQEALMREPWGGAGLLPAPSEGARVIVEG